MFVLWALLIVMADASRIGNWCSVKGRFASLLRGMNTRDVCWRGCRLYGFSSPIASLGAMYKRPEGMKTWHTYYHRVSMGPMLILMLRPVDYIDWVRSWCDDMDSDTHFSKSATIGWCINERSWFCDQCGVVGKSLCRPIDWTRPSKAAF